jgi:hypothetical protein
VAANKASEETTCATMVISRTIDKEGFDNISKVFMIYDLQSV